MLQVAGKPLATTHSSRIYERSSGCGEFRGNEVPDPRDRTPLDILALNMHVRWCCEATQGTRSGRVQAQGVKEASGDGHIRVGSASDGRVVGIPGYLGARKYIYIYRLYIEPRQEKIGQDRL